MFVETAINGRAEALITFNVGNYKISDERTSTSSLCSRWRSGSAL